MKCIWCEKAKKCIESNDQDTHELNVNGCRIEKTPDVNDQTTSTPIILTEKTSMITEIQVKQNLKANTKETDQHLNITTGLTIENTQCTSFQYTYVVVPLVVSFFFFCISIVISGWLYKKMKSRK
ncbi:hypothetical protein MS3_00011158 [Schistosoma haematobium]|uniref:Egg protein CP391S-like protein n=2 Tax=Schistosoma haematobium TaxID=6185 RepID=A0A922IJE6_SCHHA|nr:hypothetical protein MS3_00011158 [Schistosoma haematobium]KAH9580869.1 hypothetical protein MS3_00011158 [Schistosoma haematobium]